MIKLIAISFLFVISSTHLTAVKNISSIFSKSLMYMILVLGFFSLLVVQPTNTEAAREHLTITEVFVDLDNDRIEISGQTLI